MQAIGSSRKHQIEDFFRTIHEQMFNFSQNRTITKATVRYAEALAKVADQIQDSPEPDSQVVQSLQQYFDVIDKGQGFDLVCLDITMPGMDGLLALSEIGAIERARR